MKKTERLAVIHPVVPWMSPEECRREMMAAQGAAAVNGKWDEVEAIEKKLSVSDSEILEQHYRWRLENFKGGYSKGATTCFRGGRFSPK